MQNTYKLMEYRGSTCDNTDIMDNESGIYAIFGFLALYDLTGEQKWLDALIGAADYTETWTYAGRSPCAPCGPTTPSTKTASAGKARLRLGGGGGDMYMAACAYVYYRLYVITGDEHYRDYAEFIHNNTAPGQRRGRQLRLCAAGPVARGRQISRSRRSKATTTGCPGLPTSRSTPCPGCTIPSAHTTSPGRIGFPPRSARSGTKFTNPDI